MAPGALQIIVIVLLVMVLFGAGRIPVIMENLAKGINSFKKGLREGDENVSNSASVKKDKVEKDDPNANSKVE